MVPAARMKTAFEARPSQYIVPIGSTELTCMALSGLLWTLKVGFSAPDGEIPTQSNL